MNIPDFPFLRPFKNKGPIPTKSFWREKRVFTFFCPHCKMERRVPHGPTPYTSENLLRITVASLFVMLVLWPWMSWKGIVSFLPLWMIFETVFRVKMRVNLACSNCGFDPFLFLQDVHKARDGIETFWKKQYESKGLPYPGPRKDRLNHLLQEREKYWSFGSSSDSLGQEDGTESKPSSEGSEGSSRSEEAY